MDHDRPSVASERQSLLTPVQERLANVDDEGDEAKDDAPTVKTSKLKLAAAMFDFWITGVIVAAIGVLIPDIEQYYGTDDATTAFIFPSSLLGYLIATTLVAPIRRRLGLRGIAIVSPLLRIFAALIIASGPAFAILLSVNALLGLGSGLTDMAWNNWASNMTRPNVAQGLLHGSFSVGCIAGPAVAVAVLSSHSWYILYMIIAAMCGVELVLQAFAFRNDVAPRKISAQASAVETHANPSALRIPLVWTCALFFFIYQGIESVFTDWIVVYMQRVGNMDSFLAGLSSSIFWTGMALGRYSLGHVSDRFGVRRSVAAYIVIAIVFQVGLGWMNDSVGLLVLLALNGFMIAPLYPSGIVVLVSRLPGASQLTSVAVAMGLGQVGAAVAPLAVGFMATRLGLQHLIEVVSILSVLMLTSWALFSR